MELTKQQSELFEFVKGHHGDQVRKYTNEPYWHHLLDVAELTDQYVKDFGAIEIALCHDLLEDTECTWDLLREALLELSYNETQATLIADFVVHLSDHYTKEAYPQLNRARRKLFEAARLGATPYICQSVKYADLIDNTKSIVEHDHGFAKVYLSEKRDILRLMTRGNSDLFIECCYTLRSAELTIKELTSQI